jgi:signal transduction histidine kinase
MQQVAVADLVEETVDAMRPQAEAGRVAVSMQLDGCQTYAQANPERIQRVLFNLLQNAIRHTPADGSVTVRAEQRNGAVEIEVADTGTGIDPEDRAAVFDPFVQGRGEQARSGGSAGLGLAIARAIVEAHGGQIWLADAPVGTRVRFSLPRC